MSDEHKPPTDEELAELEWLHTNVVKIVAERGEGRLTQDDALLAAFPRLIARVRQLEKENRDLIFGGAVQTAIVGKRMVELAEMDRTLTLPNGTVVRAGDVLTQKVARGHWRHVFRISAVGELSMVVAVWFGSMKPDTDDFEPREPQEIPLQVTEEYWCLWSEVYPDRPVPGEE